MNNYIQFRILKFFHFYLYELKRILYLIFIFEKMSPKISATKCQFEQIIFLTTYLLFYSSSLIERILAETFQIGIKFRVIIVDAGPFYEGKELLRRLVKKRLQCTYVLLAAASYIMKEATKVLLGAHAILTNGYVMSRAGSSQVALIAKSYNVPVLICCETHKFSERVQTDAFVYNELGKVNLIYKYILYTNMFT